MKLITWSFLSVFPLLLPELLFAGPAQEVPTSQVGGPDNCSASSGVSISVPLLLDKTKVKAGQGLTGAVTYKNCSSAPVTVRQVVIATRRPGASHSGGPYDDLVPVQGKVSLPAGGTLKI